MHVKAAIVCLAAPAVAQEPVTLDAVDWRWAVREERVEAVEVRPEYAHLLAGFDLALESLEGMHAWTGGAPDRRLVGSIGGFMALLHGGASAGSAVRVCDRLRIPATLDALTDRHGRGEAAVPALERALLVRLAAERDDEFLTHLAENAIESSPDEHAAVLREWLRRGDAAPVVPAVPAREGDRLATVELGDPRGLRAAMESWRALAGAVAASEWGSHGASYSPAQFLSAQAWLDAPELVSLGTFARFGPWSLSEVAVHQRDGGLHVVACGKFCFDEIAAYLESRDVAHTLGDGRIEVPLGGHALTVAEGRLADSQVPDPHEDASVEVWLSGRWSEDPLARFEELSATCDRQGRWSVSMSFDDDDAREAWLDLLRTRIAQHAETELYVFAARAAALRDEVELAESEGVPSLLWPALGSDELLAALACIERD